MTTTERRHELFWREADRSETLIPLLTANSPSSALQYTVALRLSDQRWVVQTGSVDPETGQVTAVAIVHTTDTATLAVEFAESLEGERSEAHRRALERLGVIASQDDGVRPEVAALEAAI